MVLAGQGAVDRIPQPLQSRRLRPGARRPDQPWQRHRHGHRRDLAGLKEAVDVLAFQREEYLLVQQTARGPPARALASRPTDSPSRIRARSAAAATSSAASHAST
jgi:hypothetical protein